MSAYGSSIAKPTNKNSRLKARIFSLEERAKTKERAAIVFVPYDQHQRVPEEVEDELRKGFNSELAIGRTYPQRDEMNKEEFRSYFLACDLIVGYFVSEDFVSDLSLELPSGISTNGTLISREKIMATSTLFNPKTLAVSYYIKPNYPSRSSHICNGGFVVPEASRGLGIGGIAGKSFLYYAPRLGYKASIFNLVYETNQASVKIWKKLGFKTIGVIPKAGLLRTQDGKDEIYVDANVIYGDFEEIAVRE